MSVELPQTTIMSHRLNGKVLEDTRLLIWQIHKDDFQTELSMAVACDVKDVTK